MAGFRQEDTCDRQTARGLAIEDYVGEQGRRSDSVSNSTKASVHRFSRSIAVESFHEFSPNPQGALDGLLDGHTAVRRPMAHRWTELIVRLIPQIQELTQQLANFRRVRVERIIKSVPQFTMSRVRV